MKYFLIEDLRIVGTNWKAQQPEGLGPKALNKKDCWEKSKNLMAKPDG